MEGDENMGNYDDDAFESSNKQTSNFDDVDNDFDSFVDPTKSDKTNRGQKTIATRKLKNEDISDDEDSDDSEIDEFDKQLNDFKNVIDEDKDENYDISESIEEKPKPVPKKQTTPKPKPAAKKSKPIKNEISDDSIDDDINEFDDQINKFKGIIEDNKDSSDNYSENFSNKNAKNDSLHKTLDPPNKIEQFELKDSGYKINDFSSDANKQGGVFSDDTKNEDVLSQDNNDKKKNKFDNQIKLQQQSIEDEVDDQVRYIN